MGNRLHGRVERLDEQRTRLGRQSALEHQAAVLIVAVAHGPIRALTRLPRQRFGIHGALEAAHQPFHMMGGPVQRNHEQAVLGGRRCHPRERPHLRITQLPARHGGGDLRQLAERMGDAHFLAGGAQIKSDLEVQPVRAGPQLAVAPASAPIELGNQ
jgi:hypothetical protein